MSNSGPFTINDAFIKSTVSKDGAVYIFDPAQKAEHERLELQHHALEQLMLGKLIHAPVSSTPRRILDIGCGTGATTVRLAKEYPDAQIIGIDQATVPPIHEKPENARYLEGRFDESVEAGSLETGTFDLIFARFLVAGVQDWRKHFAICKELLAPGGWMEFQEPSVFVHYSADSMDVPIDGDWHWPKAVHDSACKRFGIDLRVGERLESLFNDAGLLDVGMRRYPFVLHPWPARPETKAQGEYFQKYAPEINRKAIGYYCQEDLGPEEIVSMQRESDETCFAGYVEGMHNRVYACWGWKGA
ncbi:Hypothetical predicted protein [Lecanosticta acicola]|uniref:Methyltransferase domain-containing protein n=1 Tax=Lecanosticta acicola TaxID=111012 RepID=A0AAI9EFJ7_9PEZI|nr:Hypothetical predicted protein [Lecanosticta acicola]